MVTQRLHNYWMTFKVVLQAMWDLSGGRVVVNDDLATILFLIVLLNIPDETTVFGVAWTGHVLMVFFHDALTGPCRIVITLLWKQEVELFIRMKHAFWYCELVEVSVYDFASFFLRQLQNVSLLPHKGLGIGFQDSDFLLIVHQVESVLMKQQEVDFLGT